MSNINRAELSFYIITKTFFLQLLIAQSYAYMITLSFVPGSNLIYSFFISNYVLSILLYQQSFVVSTRFSLYFISDFKF
jgi:hypothetical protein